MTTPKMNFPTLTLSQSGKEFTINEALHMIDSLVAGRVQDSTVSDPSTLTPADGDAYIVSTSPVNEWTGHEGELAVYFNGEWFFATPQQGLVFFDTAGVNRLLIHTGGTGRAAWVPWGEYALLNHSSDVFIGGLSQLGIGDKDWASQGFQNVQTRMEFYRDDASVEMLMHAADSLGAGRVARYSLRVGTIDWDIENDGDKLRFKREGNIQFTVDEGHVTLPPQTAAPAANAGAMSVADGTTWDPAAKGTGPYPVFYDGVNWLAMT